MSVVPLCRHLNGAPSNNAGVGLWEVTLVLLVLINLVAEGARRHKKQPSWLNPCRAPDYRSGKGRHQSTPSQLQVNGRGHRSSPRPLRRLRTQVSNTWTHLASITPGLPKIICNKVSNFGSKIQYNFLPMNQSHWYRKHVKCLDKNSKLLILLPKFQEGLEKFAASFEQLKTTRFSPTVTSDCKARRQKVMDELSAKLNQLLCELDKTMSDMKIVPHRRLTEEEAMTFMPDFARDITTGQLYDWGVLSSYDAFMADWHRIIRQVVGPKGDAKCHNKAQRNKLQLSLT